MIERDPKAPAPAEFGPPEHLEPPAIPDHQLLRRIGRGSYGEVWLARSVTGAYRAVKIVHRRAFDHDRPFEREFSGILKFEPISRKHDSQMNILHVGRGEDCFFYIMELADDQLTGQQIHPDSYAPKSLKSELFHRGKLPFEECVQISLAMTTALANLHSQGLVHRDIKPSNVIFVNGVVKLADIGLVTSVDASRSFVGTEGFVPPEGPGTPQADLYSLGKVLYELCTGKDRQEFPELPTDLDAWPDRDGLIELNAVIAKACRQDPRQRYTSAKAMHADLLLLQSGKSLARLHATQRALANLKRVSVVGGLTTALAFAALFWQVHESRQMRRLAGENLHLAMTGQQAAAQSRARWVEMRVAKGVEFLEQADASSALPSLAEALNAVDEPAQEEVHRIRLESALKSCPGLVQVFAHDECINYCEFSPDGRRLVTASRDFTARVWDLKTGEAVTPALWHQGRVRTASFTPDGRRVVTASADGTAKVWNATTGVLVANFQQHRKQLFSAFFNKDGTRVVTSSDDHTARIWDAATGEQVGPPLQHSNSVGFAIFSPDGARIATASLDHTARLWDATTGQPLTAPLLHHDQVGGLAFSPDGDRLATYDGQDGARIWDARSGEALSPWLKHDSGTVTSIAFSPDGRLLASVSLEIRIWNAFNGDLACPAIKTDYKLEHVQFSPDGGKILACSDSGFARVWDVYSGMPLTPRLWHSSYVWYCAFSPDGRFVATASDDHTLKVWDQATMQNEILHLHQPNGIGSASFSPDGGRILAGCEDGLARLWDAKSGRLLEPSFRHGNHESLALAEFSPDGRKILTAWGITWAEPDDVPHDSAAAEARAEARIWDSQTGKELCQPLKHKYLVTHAAFSLDSRRVLTTSSDGTAEIWDANTGARIAGPLAHAGGVSDGDFSPDGRLVATAGADSIVQVWDAATAARVVSLAMTNHEPVRLVRFSPDGNRILTVNGKAQTGRIWDAHSGRPITPAFKHGGNVYLGAWSPDGRRVIMSGLYGAVGVWDADTGEAVLEPMGSSFYHPNFESVSIAYSPDGRFIVAGNGSVWSAADGHELLVHPLNEVGIWQVGFSPDSREVFGAYDDGTIRVWGVSKCEIEKKDLIRLAEVMAGSRLIQTTSLPPDQLVSNWRSLRSKYPKVFQATPDEVRRFYESGLRDSQNSQYLFGALFYADQLIELTPGDSALLQTRTNLLSRRVPLRDPKTRPELIDLSDYYNTLLAGFWLPGEQGQDLDELPIGVQNLGGVAFDIRGMVRVHAANELVAGSRLPSRVSGIRVRRTCQRLHFLHASQGASDIEGAKIGTYQINYADGRQLVIPIVYGEDLRDWHELPHYAKEASRARIVWEGHSTASRQEGSVLRLFMRTWENPFPKIEVKSTDFVAAPASAQPFLVAITAE